MFRENVTMEGMVPLNKREQKRLMVLNYVEKGKMRGGEAAVVLGISLRHVRRLLADYRRELWGWHMATGEGSLPMFWIAVSGKG